MPVRRTRYAEATVEIHEVLIVRSGGSVREPCDQCLPAMGAMVSSEPAASMTGVPLRAVFRFLEAGLIHYRERNEQQQYQSHDRPENVWYILLKQNYITQDE